jgi:hypothetical protein
MIPVDTVPPGRDAMARAKAKGPRNMPAVIEVEGKSIRLELPADVHQLFRVEAAKEGTSMAAVARRLVEDYLRRKGVVK